MSVWIRRIRTTAVRVAVLGPGIYFLQIITQMFIKEERSLNLDAWYPYDWTKSPAYELTILTQVIGVLGNCSIVYVFPPLYATLVVIACSQLEKVRIALSNIKQQYIAAEITSPNDEQWQLRASDDDFTRMEGQLNKCIRLHQEIIRFIMELEENFSTLFVGVFLILMLSLCFSTFSAVLRWGNAVNVSLSLQSYCMYLIFIFLFCWFPSELTDQGERVRDAAWSCDWIGTPVSFQRSLSLVIASANKEFILTAGKCVPVSKQTMLNMIQESISLFMFLMQVRGEDESEE
ncbi:odorant receptor Or2-like [Periplaneta americana]|uniref:odorant receptor Or2-like n=1 Tax=Periplaneta americana TaxID=6978 RepID=UPI0037E8E731